MKNTLLFLVILFSAHVALSQDSLKTKDLYIGAGMVAYKGDLGSGYSGASLMGVIGIKFNNLKKLNGNVNLTFGKVTGQELDYVYANDATATPNTFFSTSFIGLNYDMQFNVIHRPKLKVYISQGVGLIRYDAKDEFSNSLSEQSETRAISEDFQNLTIILPTMIGVKYTLPNNFGLGMQTGFYNIMSDYVDNISQWGNKSGNDNLLSVRFQLYVPIHF